MHRDSLFSASRFNLFGLSYLSRYVMTLDSPNGFVYLQRAKHYSTLDPLGTSGMAIKRTNEQLIVASVRPDGPADLAGIQVGDQLLTIDNEDGATVDMFRARQLLTSGPGRSVHLTLSRRGQLVEAHLTIKDRLAW